MQLDPKSYGLPPRTVLERVGDTTIALVINRKSRIIMTDGRKILEKVSKIKDLQPGTVVQLRTSTPVCSKTTAFLESEGIKIINK